MSSLACCNPYYTEYTCKDTCIKCCPDTCYSCCRKYYSHIVMGKTTVHEKEPRQDSKLSMQLLELIFIYLTPDKEGMLRFNAYIEKQLLQMEIRHK